MIEPGVRRRPGGRSARVRAAVHDATLDLLLARGLDGLKVSEIAERAEVHETSIYRRWGTRENLLLDAVLSATEQQLHVPDTGSLRNDLIAYATDLATFLATPVGRALELTLAAAGDDPETQRARDRYWASRFERSQQMITRAVARGELPDTVQPRLILQMLVSPVHFRVLLTREPVAPRMPALIVDALLDGVALPPGRKTGRAERPTASVPSSECQPVGEQQPPGTTIKAAN